MSRVISIRMSEQRAERLARLARRYGRSIGETSAILVEEALRMQDFAFITFRDSVVGRQAYIQGTGIAIWEVSRIARAYGGDAGKVAEHLGWPSARVRAALQYAAAYPEEIDAAIEDNASYDALKITRTLPGTIIFTAAEHTPDENPAHRAASATG